MPVMNRARSKLKTKITKGRNLLNLGDPAGQQGTAEHLPGLIFAALERGRKTRNEIYSYISGRGVRFSEWKADQILAKYQGRDYDENLWWQYKDGSYEAIHGILDEFGEEALLDQYA